MQFRVPQNIAMEDRIVGPLTAIQFGILVVGGGISFFIFTSSTIPTPVNRIIGSIAAFVTVMLAIGKFNDQPMYRFIRFIIAFIASPKVRIWHKNGPEIQLVKPTQKKQNAQQAHAAKHVSKQDIARLAVVLDSRGSAGLPPKIDTSNPHPS